MSCFTTLSSSSNGNHYVHVQPTDNTTTTQKKKKKVAVIGAGAAGLTMTRILQRYNNNELKSGDQEQPIDITVFESSQKQGGIWRYENNSDKKKSRPMYSGLKTNLPKEIMAYREYPWYDTLQGCETTESFVTHAQVQQYLQSYSRHFSLNQYIHYGCQVQELKLLLHNETPQVLLKWSEHQKEETVNQESCKSDVFDAVCICNGHYSKPSVPKIEGLDEYFHGNVIHSIEYDDPSFYTDRIVLCVGGRASGADITKEISQYSKKVYISDSTCPYFSKEDGPPSLQNIIWVPKTKSINKDGSVVFEDSTKNTFYTCSDIDTIIFCTGYDYHFPFLKSFENNDNTSDHDNDNGQANENDSQYFDQLFSTSILDHHDNNSDDDVAIDLPICFTPSERRVVPLNDQIFHAIFSEQIAFVGLPHSVVPFSLMELQAEAIVEQWFGGRSSNEDNHHLLSKSLEERLSVAKQDAISGGPRPDRHRVQDTHYLGDYQWKYLRELSQHLAHNYSDKMEQFISKQESIYNDTSAERKNLFPGGPDTYRQTRYTILNKPPYFTKLSSLQQATTNTSTNDQQCVMTDK